jgi:ribosomal-protein-alanine N-acetyltransferase
MLPLSQTVRARAGATRAHELETARLRLRLFTPEDTAELSRITRDPEVMRYIADGRPLTWDETDHNLKTIVRAFCRRGYGRWAMVHKASGRLLGYCGFTMFDEEVGVELAYMLARPYWGMGLAAEAARACLRYAFDTLKLGSLAALTMPGNARSRRLLDMLGMRLVGARRLRGYDCVEYRIGREDFRPDDSLYLAKPVLLPPPDEQTG